MNSRVCYSLSPAGTFPVMPERTIYSSHATFIFAGCPHRLAQSCGSDSSLPGPLTSQYEYHLLVCANQTRCRRFVLRAGRWRELDKRIVAESIVRLRHMKSFLYLRRVAASSSLFLRSTAAQMSASGDIPLRRIV